MDRNIYSQLANLNISVCGTEESSISAWAGKNMPDTVAFLNWFTEHLDKNNILDPNESEEYEYLVANDLLLPDDEYDNVINELERTHPGIFDTEMNQADLDILEIEYKSLAEYERSLDDQIKINQDNCKSIEKQISATKNKNNTINVEFKDAYEKCLKEANNIDAAYKTLYSDVLNCIKSWENGSNLFCFNDEIREKYRDAMENVNRFRENITFASVTMEFDDDSDEELEFLEKRLFNSLEYLYIAETKEAQLEAELAFYKDSEYLEGSFSNSDGERYAIQIEALTMARRHSVENLIKTLKETINEFVKNHIDKLKITKIGNTISDARKKLENMSNVENIISDLLGYNILHKYVFTFMDKRIQSMDLLLKQDLLEIINTDLNNSKRRTELMKKKIQEEKEFHNKSIDEQCGLIKVILDIMAVKSQTITPETFSNEVIKFHRKIDDLEKKVFFDDIANFRASANIIERNIYFMKQYLKSKASNEIVICPLEYQLNLLSLKSTLTEAGDVIAKIVQSKKYAEDTLKEKRWFKIKRRLWMYYLVKPDKMFHYLEEVATEINNKISEKIKDNIMVQNVHKYINE